MEEEEVFTGSFLEVRKVPGGEHKILISIWNMDLRFSIALLLCCSVAQIM